MILGAHDIMWSCGHQAMWSWIDMVMNWHGLEVMWSWGQWSWYHEVMRSCGHEVMGLCGLRSYSHEFMLSRSWGHMVIWSFGHESFGYEVMRSCRHEVKWLRGDVVCLVAAAAFLLLPLVCPLLPLLPGGGGDCRPLRRCLRLLCSTHLSAAWGATLK